MCLLHPVICTLVCSLQNDEKPQIAKFAFQYRNVGMVKCVFCTCCSLHCSKSPTSRTSLQWNRKIRLKRGWDLTDVLATRRFALLVKSLQWKRNIQCGNSFSWILTSFIWALHFSDDAAKLVLPT